jgi:hypothetical protein
LEERPEMTKKLDELANLWNKTKDPKYKDLWYKFVKEFANVQNVSDINTIVRRDSTSRGIPIAKTNGSTRVSNVCGRSARSDSDV